MAITPITQPSRAPAPVRDDRDWHDKVLRGLQIANTAFQIPVAISDWQKKRAETLEAQERAATEKALRPSKEREQQDLERQQEIKRDVAEEEFAFRQKSDPMIRNIPSATDRKSIGLIGNAYHDLNVLETALEGGIPLNSTVGDNLSTAARARFVQFFGRELSGANIADASAMGKFLSSIGVSAGGKEFQQFEALVPGINDTVATARTKLDEMKIRLERMAVTRGAPNAKEFVEFVNRTGRPVEPLSRTPKSVDEKTGERIGEKVGEIGSAAVKGVGAAFGKATEKAAETVKELSPVKAIRESIDSVKKKIEQITGSRLTPEEVRSFGRDEADEPAPPLGDDVQLGPRGGASITPEDSEKIEKQIRQQELNDPEFLQRTLENMQIHLKELQKKPAGRQGASLTQPTGQGLAGLTGGKQVVTKQGGLGAITRKKIIGGV